MTFHETTPEIEALLAAEKPDWTDALDFIKEEFGTAAVREIVRIVQERALTLGVNLNEASLNTPYINTIPPMEQPTYPGDIGMEQRIEKLARWNAMAMVLHAADTGEGVGGHIATYASAATLLEVGFNHFFRARSAEYGGDLVIPQPHAAPGLYARAFLEGRLTETQLSNFRRQRQAGGGLSSYPHPRLMPSFWQIPCASMGLSTPSAIYQARFAKYLENRGLKPRNGGKVWCFIGDGEADEPEVLGTVSIAARERLDNLVLVVNCNLQRLDGPVRGNGKIIQELERRFRGADWNVIKVIWGSGWDALLAQDHEGVLRRRMEEAVDGDYQYYSVLPGDRQREHWVENNPLLAQMMNSLSDDEIKLIKRGGQDPKKIHAAYARAAEASGKPTVILIKTVKGDGMGAIQGQNTVHQKKNLKAEERIQCGRDYGVPLDDDALAAAAFYRPPLNSPETTYLQARRQALGGHLPARIVDCPSLQAPSLELLAELVDGSNGRAVSSTTAAVRLLTRLMKDPAIGPYVVPIVPDEARTFGMDALFKAAGIYSPEGQHYTPVDAGTLLPYREAADGQILQEGICETGAMASFLAAGTAYAMHGVPTIPFYFFYSIFGFQRVGDMIWACGDSLCRGFLIGGTAGRTTLNGEGLQHQDGHSPVLASTVPNLLSYDPAFAFELALIVREGIRRMYEQQESVFYYLTVYNETYAMPPMPEGVEAGVLKGLYCYREGSTQDTHASINLLASGSILQQALVAADRLEALGHSVNVWSATSFTELYRDALECERWNRLHPLETPQVPYVSRVLDKTPGVFVAVSDYMKSQADLLSRWIPGRFTTLGTDGYGLSEGRDSLREYFEISPPHIMLAALDLLARDGLIEATEVERVLRVEGINRDAPSPAKN